MKTIVRTTYSTHPTTGAGRIVAKCDGKQLTTPYDPAKSSDWNHGAAAGNLLTSGKFDGLLISLTAERIAAMEHDSNESGSKHGFAV